MDIIQFDVIMIEFSLDATVHSIEKIDLTQILHIMALKSNVCFHLRSILETR